MVIGHGWHFHRSVYPGGVCAAGLQPSAVIFVMAACAGAQNSKSKEVRTEGLQFRNAAPGVRYVGSNMCKGCHSAIYQQYSRTDMAHSTSLPGSILDKGWLAKPVDIFNQKLDRHYQVFARDGKVYQSEYGLDQQGKELFRHTEELAYVVGTGANGVTPIVRRDNYLFQAPVSYYTAKEAWDLSPNYEEHDLGFSLPVTADCIGCHTGRTQPVKGREGLYEDDGVILPTIERLRYRSKASGYHGGATPQEVVAPAAVFLPVGLELPGFAEAVPTTPDWWRLDRVEVVDPPKVLRSVPGRTARGEEQEQLFGSEALEEPAEASTPDWIAALLSSRRYLSQRERALRPPSNERVATTLTELGRRGGVAPVELLSETLGVPSTRGRSIISSMQALLNVDGYGILALDSGTNEVRLSLPMLESRFEL